jgi:site-specific recombinase XerD
MLTISAPIHINTFCHLSATQSWETGYDIGRAQELPGHNDVFTTMIYTHVLNKPGISVKSLLDG